MMHEMNCTDACQQAERVRAGVQQFGWALEQLPQMHVSIGLAFVERSKVGAETGNERSLSTLMGTSKNPIF